MSKTKESEAYSIIYEILQKLNQETGDKEGSQINSFILSEQISKSDNYIVMILITELAIALSDKIQMKGHVDVLKEELELMDNKRIDLEKKIIDERNHFNGSLNKLQEQIKAKDAEFKDRHMKYMSESNKYLTEITNLKNEVASQKELQETSEKNISSRISSLENELQLSRQSNAELTDKFENLKEKTTKYKEKFKIVMGMLEKMNKIILEMSKKKHTTNKKCQTEIEQEPMYNEPLNATLPHTRYSCEVKHDNLISELFFKQSPFSDNLEALLAPNKIFKKFQ